MIHYHDPKRESGGGGGGGALFDKSTSREKKKCGARCQIWKKKKKIGSLRGEEKKKKGPDRRKTTTRGGKNLSDLEFEPRKKRGNPKSCGGGEETREINCLHNRIKLCGKKKEVTWGEKKKCSPHYLRRGKRESVLLARDAYGGCANSGGTAGKKESQKRPLYSSSGEERRKLFKRRSVNFDSQRLDVRRCGKKTPTRSYGSREKGPA